MQGKISSHSQKNEFYKRLVSSEFFATENVGRMIRPTGQIMDNR